MTTSKSDPSGPAKPTASPEPKPNHLLVAIVTTSGSWPKEGFDEVPINQPLKVQLQHAATKLPLTNTNGWVARVGTRELNPDQNYRELGLSGKVEIDYGPREGGGGRE